MPITITQESIKDVKNRFNLRGNSQELNDAIVRAMQVAPYDISVLVHGESGTGKETIPQIIHQNSRRRNGRYLAVNCGAIPEGTINAELFGHEKGAFTGAVGERKGYFEEADGGTLFLDEIGELPRETQAMLLRVLQNGEFLRVGASVPRKTDVRIIAATNVNLWEAVRRGKFREDLYYRLNAVQITMPALRDRRDDIYLLFRKFTSDFSEKYGVCKIALSHDAISLLKAYRWPGNVRQLKNVAEAISAMESRPISPGAESIVLDATALMHYLPEEKDTLLPAVSGGTQGAAMDEESTQMIVRALFDLKARVESLSSEVEMLKRGPSLPQVPQMQQKAAGDTDEAEWQEQAEAEDSAEEEVAAVSLRKAKDDLIEKTLAKHNGRIKDAARELGISERTIYRKIAQKKEK